MSRSKKTSDKQIAANRRNAQKSTGPRTAKGRAVSRMNALKHGILSREVLVGGENGRESAPEFAALHRRFFEDWQPVGVTEEMLVEQIVTAYWRLRRALRAEAGETALSIDRGHWKRSEGPEPSFLWAKWRLLSDPVPAMQKCSLGNSVLEDWLVEVRQAVEREGELTEAAIERLSAHLGTPANRLTLLLKQVRQRFLAHPDGLEPEALRAQQQAEALKTLDQEIATARLSRSVQFECEEMEETARVAASTLPSAEVLEKIQLYETKLHRQIARALTQLERLQRQRRGEVLPAPLTVELSERD